jgi:hypothetical protein
LAVEKMKNARNRKFSNFDLSKRAGANSTIVSDNATSVKKLQRLLLASFSQKQPNIKFEKIWDGLGTFWSLFHKIIRSPWLPRPFSKPIKGSFIQGCQIFLLQHTKTVENIQNNLKIFLMTTQHTKSQQNRPNGHKIDQHLPL